jgi:hypothetical protein
MVAELFADTLGFTLGVSREMKAPKIVMDPFAPSAIKEFVQNGVDNHNIAVTGNAPYYPVGFYVMDSDGSVLGGLMQAGEREEELERLSRGAAPCFDQSLEGGTQLGIF